MEESIVHMHKATEISPSLSTFKNPMKRHCQREDSSVVWFDLGKTKPLKKYRCISQEHGHQENAVISEVQEQAWSQKTSYLYFGNSVPHPESPFLSTEGNNSFKHSFKPSLAAEPNSSESTQSDSSATNLEEPYSDQVSQLSGLVKRKELKLKGELKTHNDQQSFNADSKDQTRVGMNRKTGEYLDLDVEHLPLSALAANCFEVPRSYLDPMYIDQQDGTEAALVDVHLTVKASHRAENVPFVCLTSQACGTPILGYPLEVGEIRDGSETLLPTKESVAYKLFGERGSRFPQLVWRRSKRTPVCYVTNSLSPSSSKNVQAKQARRNVEDSISLARENSVLIKEKSLVELLKKPKHYDQGKTAMSKTCVPVKHIFSKILGAVC